MESPEVSAGNTGEVTRLLRDWRQGDDEAAQQLVPLVYQELRRLAVNHLRKESEAWTLQPTALINEAYLRLVDLELEWQGRTHFFAVAAGVMRRILVDVARARKRVKRGGGLRPLSLEGFDGDGATVEAPCLTAVDEALAALEVDDARKARAVELRYFAGLSNAEIAEVLQLSLASVERDLRLARAWLSRRLRPPSSTDGK